MIDTTKLQSSSLFAGFANLDKPLENSVTIPAGQAIPGFGTLTFTFDVKRANPQSLSQVLFQVVGPSTLYGLPFDSNQWKASASSFATWFRPDDVLFEIDCDVLYSGDVLRLRVSYLNLDFSTTTYNTEVTVNAKVFFFKYPWE